MSSTTLFYFNGRGRAEILRIMMGIAGIEYTEVFLEEKEDMDKLKREGKLLFNEVPVLEVDGRLYAQTMAIVRYLARRAKLYGSTDDEANRIDECHEGAMAFQHAYLMMGFVDETSVKEGIEKKTLPKYLPIFEKLLKKNGDNGYLVGNKVSFADAQLLEAILSTIDYFSENTLESYPCIKTFHKTMLDHKGVQNYMAKRKKMNDETYITKVKRVLGM